MSLAAKRIVNLVARTSGSSGGKLTLSSSSLLLRTSPLSSSHRYSIVPSLSGPPSFISARAFTHSSHLQISQSFRSLEKSQPQGNKINDKPNQEEQKQKEDEDDDSAARKGSFRQRLQFLTRRYGWWALAVYLGASTIDLSLVFTAVHMLGANHIRELEAKVRCSLGLAERDTEVEENQEKRAINFSSTIWTEAVLAYTIHKTLLLPFRVAFTAAVTPSFVKWLVKMGWAKSHTAVKKAVQSSAASVIKKST